MNNLYNYSIKVTRVIDGDTVDAMIDLGFDTHVFKRIRFLGINTPEKHGITMKIGKEATAHLEQILKTPGRVLLECKELGKFGRALGRVLIETESGETIDVNQRMIDDGHALPYFGESRSDEDFLTEEFLRGRQAA